MPSQLRVEHKFIGKPLGPCAVCGKGIKRHRERVRAEHKFCGKKQSCTRCGLSLEQHRDRDTAYGKENSPLSKRRDSRVRMRHSPAPTRFIGIDGEGQGRHNHRYILLAAGDGTGENWSVENISGLGTKVCLDFILGLPDDARIFAYAFNYDLTMMLKDLDNRLLYYLFRPELRKRKTKQSLGPLPIAWEGYRINLQGTKFTVSKGDRTRIIWDIWKFYQCRFVKALEQWSIGAEDRAYLDEMKLKRGSFDELTIEDIKPYCFMECRHLAHLGQKLINAHIDAGIRLASFYGAGSTGSAILKQMKVKQFSADPPKNLVRVVAQSFFGGRFENSRIGLIKDTVYSYDISSAYPYHTYFLPCLQHSKWEYITSRNALVTPRRNFDDSGSHVTKGNALVHYRLHKPESSINWGPLPFRLPDGGICFPEASGGGWVWLNEYLAAETMFSNIEFVEAWTLHVECDCRPFEKLSHYYLERLRIGKEGAGWVFKLGPNACYGKLAQSIGDGPYTCWIWASIITSETRAQLLRLMRQHQSLDNVLMLATDGCHTLERIITEKPKDTGTYNAAGKDGKIKPLGGWEEKIIEGGVFYARPGVYFPMNADKEEVRGRGLGRMTLYDNRETIMKAWEKGQTAESSVLIGDVVRFLGAKSSISVRGKDLYVRGNDFGQWRRRPIELSFDPKPKRESILSNGRLEVRNMPLTQESKPYSRALGGRKEIASDVIIPILRAAEVEEQPDVTLGVYDDEGDIIEKIG